MSVLQLITDEIARIEHILVSVPFMARSEASVQFLNIFKLTYADIKRLNITEENWEDDYEQISANKLLKLAISFGNVIEAFNLEKQTAETKVARLRGVKRIQSSDPFNEGFCATKPSQIPLHFVNLIRNFTLVLKNFDIGSSELSFKTLKRHISNLSVYSREDSEDAVTPTSLFPLSAPRPASLIRKSPIRLNSKQMLIEKLEINIRIDPMFTMRVVLKLLVEILTIIENLWKDQEEAEEELAPTVPLSSSSSVFSGGSGGSEPLSYTDYRQLVKASISNVNGGVVGPFVSFLQREVVEPRIKAGFENILNTM